MSAPFPRRVVVSHGPMVYQCHAIKTGFLCGCCGIGEFGPRPITGDVCDKCGARVEESL